MRRNLPGPDGSCIWLAQDEVLGKDITLHFVPDAVLRDARAIAELRAEVKKNRQLIHPSILRVYDFVEDGAMAAISMDKFDGESLGEMLKRRGGFDPNELLPWLKDLAETLDDAHRVQLIHRDLAPDNLYLRGGGGILVKGFGISRAIRDALERAGVARGEAAHLAYMSPQLIDGERPSPADDVYGFGVLVFELLTGRLPFTGDNLVQQIRKAVPPSISEAMAAAGKGGDFPASWQNAVASCLAKAPDQRPKNCAEVVKLFAQDKGRVVPVLAPVDVKPVQTAAERSVEPSRVQDVARSAGALHGLDKSGESAKTAPATESVSAKPTGQFPPPPPPLGTKPPPLKRSLPESYPDLERPKSKFRLVALAVAALAVGFALVSKFMGDPEVENPESPDGIANAGDSAGNTTDSAAKNDPDHTPPAGSGNIAATSIPPAPGEGGQDGRDVNTGAVANSSNTPLASGGGPEKTGSETEVPDPATVRSDSIAASAKPRIIGADQPNGASTGSTEASVKPADSVPPKPAAADMAMPLPPIPEPPPKLVVPKDATEAQLDQIIVERTAAYEKLRQILAAIEVANEENASLRDRKKAELDEAARMFAEKRKTLAPVIQAASAIETERKRLEDMKVKAEAAAVEAVKAAEAAKKAYEDLVTSAGEKLAAKEAAEAQLRSLEEKVTSVKKFQDDLGEIITQGNSQAQQVQLALRRAEDEQKTLKAAFDAARTASAAKMAAANKAKIAAIEEQAKVIEAQRARYASALLALKDLPEMADSAQKMEAKIAEADAQIAGLRSQIDQLSGGAPAPSSITEPASKPPLPEPSSRKPEASAQPPAPAPPVAELPAPASEPVAGTNSLGIEFVQVGEVAFSKHLITRAQFESFSKAVALKPERWRNPGFAQGPDHPVVNVSWREADEFCKWLTAKERKEGKLKSGEVYRLPTDLEWSKAVGLPPESGATPEDRDMRVENIYPWGTQWPPPEGAGNFAGEETDTELPIRGYNDGYPHTSPVTAFKPNALGLHDMSGNVWQWVQDAWDSKGSEKTLRGGSWYNGAIPMSLLSSCRIKSSPDTIHDTYGFRIVKAKSPGKSR